MMTSKTKSIDPAQRLAELQYRLSNLLQQRGALGEQYYSATGKNAQVIETGQRVDAELNILPLAIGHAAGAIELARLHEQVAEAESIQQQIETILERITEVQAQKTLLTEQRAALLKDISRSKSGGQHIDATTRKANHTELDTFSEQINQASREVIELKSERQKLQNAMRQIAQDFEAMGGSLSDEATWQTIAQSAGSRAEVEARAGI